MIIAFYITNSYFVLYDMKTCLAVVLAVVLLHLLSFLYYVSVCSFTDKFLTVVELCLAQPF